MEKKDGNIQCTKCGTENSEAVKFCGNCGEMSKLEEEVPEQAQEEVPEQTQEEVPEQAQEEVPEEVQGQGAEQSNEQTQEQQKPKKKVGLIVAGVVGLVAVILIAVLLLGSGPAGNMRSQLRALDSTSYSDIKNWVENDFVESFAEYFNLRIVAIDTEDQILGDGFLDDQERFIEWSFEIDRDQDELLITLLYEELDLVALLVPELEGLDNGSLSVILNWMDRVENEFGPHVNLQMRTVCVDGDSLNAEVADEKNQDFLVEWSFNYRNGPILTIEIELLFNTVRTAHFGDSFVLGDLEIAFDGELGWGLDEDQWSSSFGEEYFMVPVTLTNRSDTTMDYFSPGLYSPDGTEIQKIIVSEEDITLMDELLPGDIERGYIFIKFYEDGDYIIQLEESPFIVRVVIPVDSVELRGSETPLRPAPTMTLEDLAEETQGLVDIFEDNFDGMLRIEVDYAGDNELIFYFITFEPVPAGNAHLVTEFMEGVVEGMMLFYGITAFRVMLELHLDNTIITTVFLDSTGTEFFRDSVEFPL